MTDTYTEQAMTEPTVNLIRDRGQYFGDESGKVETMYRFEMTKDGRFRVRAKYTGLKTGCIGSAGKSFKTEAERDVALLYSVEAMNGWHGWTKTP